MQLGLTVKCGDIALEINESEGITRETDFVIDGYYFENNLETQVSGVAIANGRFVYLSIDVSAISSNQINVPHSFSHTVTTWMKNHGPIFVGRTVKLTPTSKHYSRYGDSLVTIIAFNQCPLNKFDDSSLAELDIRWRNRESKFVVVVNFNPDLINRETPTLDELEKGEGNLLSSVGATHTLLTVGIDEIVPHSDDTFHLVSSHPDGYLLRGNGLSKSGEFFSSLHQCLQRRNELIASGQLRPFALYLTMKKFRGLSGSHQVSYRELSTFKLANKKFKKGDDVKAQCFYEDVARH